MKTQNYRIEIHVHCTEEQAKQLTEKVSDLADNAFIYVDAVTVLINANNGEEIN